MIKTISGNPDDDDDDSTSTNRKREREREAGIRFPFGIQAGLRQVRWVE